MKCAVSIAFAAVSVEALQVPVQNEMDKCMQDVWDGCAFECYGTFQSIHGNTVKTCAKGDDQIAKCEAIWRSVHHWLFSDSGTIFARELLVIARNKLTPGASRNINTETGKGGGFYKESAEDFCRDEVKRTGGQWKGLECYRDKDSPCGPWDWSLP